MLKFAMNRWRRLGWSRHDVADRVAATVVLVLAVALFAQSAQYGFFRNDRPGPGLFPGIVAGALAVVSFAWLIIGAGAKTEARNAPQNEAEEIPAAEDQFDRAGLRRIAFVVLWATVPLLLFERAGYFLTMTVYVTGLLVVIGRARPGLSLAGTIIGVAVTAVGADAIGVVLPDPFGLLALMGV